MNSQIIKLKANDVFCREGDKASDLYLIKEGRLLVCVTKGFEVTPIAYPTKGEYLGELAFFDNHPRSANIIALTETTLEKLSTGELKRSLPPWILGLAQSLAKRLRLADDIIRQKGLGQGRAQSSKSIKPISKEKQSFFLKLLGP